MPRCILQPITFGRNGMENGLRISALIVGMAIVSGISNAASFDCKKARSKVEIAICGDAELNKLDEQLSASYKSAMTTFPVRGYLRARQREWLGLNQSCDARNFVGCLRKNYMDRLDQLAMLKSVQVFANTKTFSYEDGDAVVEIVPMSGYVRLGIWGGFLIHKQASQDSGKPVYVGCEFEGKLRGDGMQSAVSEDGTQINFQIKGNIMEFEDGIDQKICTGFGRLPVQFRKASD